MSALPDGLVTVTLPIWVMDADIDDFAAVGRIARITVSFTLDATEGNASLTERLLRELSDAQRTAATPLEAGKPMHMPSDSNIRLEEIKLEGCDLVIPLGRQRRTQKTPPRFCRVVFCGFGVLLSF